MLPSFVNSKEWLTERVERIGNAMNKRKLTYINHIYRIAKSGFTK